MAVFMLPGWLCAPAVELSPGKGKQPLDPSQAALPFTAGHTGPEGAGDFCHHTALCLWQVIFTPGDSFSSLSDEAIGLDPSSPEVDDDPWQGSGVAE